jgi:hypothetical protein
VFGFALRVERAHAGKAVQGRIASDSLGGFSIGHAFDCFGKDRIAVAQVDLVGIGHVITPSS